tara:strand:+ start:3600 stop:3920 length:321 start_codon:yes stop_codon:yes gene_type:complete
MKHFVVNPNRNMSFKDIDCIFGPMDGTEEIVAVVSDDLAAMAAEAGVFKSRSEARRNGLSGPCPTGVWQFGTKKKRFWVWNPDSPTSKVTVNLNFDKSERWFGVQR